MAPGGGLATKKNVFHQQKVKEEQRQFYERAKTITKYKRLKRKLAANDAATAAGAGTNAAAPVLFHTAPKTAAVKTGESFYDKIFSGHVDGRDKEELEEFIHQQYRRKDREHGDGEQKKRKTDTALADGADEEDEEEEDEEDEVKAGPAKKARTDEPFFLGEGAGDEEDDDEEEEEEEEGEQEKEGEEKGKETNEKTSEKGTKKTKKEKSSKPDPFFNERKKWEEAQEQKRKAREEREARIRKKQETIEKRKQKTQQLRQRSKRGQPIMANLLSHYLDKLAATATTAAATTKDQ